MGALFSRGLPKGGETVQVVCQVFQADFDFRAAAAFWRIPVQTFQLFPKDLPRDQHLQNSQLAPEFFQPIVPFIHEEKPRLRYFVHLFYLHTETFSMITNIDKKSSGLDFKLIFFGKKALLSLKLLDAAFFLC